MLYPRVDGRNTRSSLTLVGALIAGLCLTAPVVRAHEAIGLLIESPRSGARSGPDVEVVLRAQAVLGGVEQTDFTLLVDGRRVRTGVIRVGSTQTLTLRDLRPGSHRVAVIYRPDTDEPPRTSTVRFAVQERSSPWWPYALGGAIAAGALLALALRLVWRSR